MRKVCTRYWRLVIALVLCVSLSGCRAIRNINKIAVTSVGIKSVNPTSSRSAEAILLLEIDNPSLSFTASDINGTIKYNDKVMGSFTAGKLPVVGRTKQVYELPCTARLAEGVSVLEVMKIASKRSLEGATADVDARVDIGKLGKKLKFRNLDLKEMMTE